MTTLESYSVTVIEKQIKDLSVEILLLKNRTVFSIPNRKIKKAGIKALEEKHKRLVVRLDLVKRTESIKQYKEYINPLSLERLNALKSSMEDGLISLNSELAASAKVSSGCWGIDRDIDEVCEDLKKEIIKLTEKINITENEIEIKTNTEKQNTQIKNNMINTTIAEIKSNVNIPLLKREFYNQYNKVAINGSSLEERVAFVQSSDEYILTLINTTGIIEDTINELEKLGGYKSIVLELGLADYKELIEEGNKMIDTINLSACQQQSKPYTAELDILYCDFDNLYTSPCHIEIDAYYKVMNKLDLKQIKLFSDAVLRHQEKLNKLRNKVSDLWLISSNINCEDLVNKINVYHNSLTSMVDEINDFNKKDQMDKLKRKEELQNQIVYLEKLRDDAITDAERGIKRITELKQILSTL